MPLYRYKTYSAFRCVDDVAIEMPDVLTAEREALRTLGQMLIDAAGDTETSTVFGLTMMDSRGELVFRAKTSLSQTAAAVHGSGMDQHRSVIAA